MSFIFGNFFNTELTAGVSVSATTLLVPPSATLNLPVVAAPNEARLVLWDGVLPPEIVSCTVNDQTGTLTVTRAMEGTTAQAWSAGTQVQSTITEEVINTALAAYFDFTAVLNASFLKLAGGTLTGPLVLSADPTVPLGAVTKQYADNVQGNKLPLTGGTMSGSINMNNNRILSLPAPISTSEPATKAYVDDFRNASDTTTIDQSGYLITGGSSTAYTFASARGYNPIFDSLHICITFHVDSGLNPTLQVDTNGPVAIHYPQGTPVPFGGIKANIPIHLTYRQAAGAFIVHNLPLSDLDHFPADIKASLQTVDHGKWLLADGRAVNRVGQFGGLFAIASTRWGVGNGSTTFNILDGRGRCIAGADNMGGVVASRITIVGSGIDGTLLGNSGGQQTVILTTAQLATHSHAVATFTDPGHSHTLNNGTGVIRTGTSLNPTTAGTGFGLGDTITVNGSFTGITFSMGNAGSDQAHTNMQPISIANIFVRW